MRKPSPRRGRASHCSVTGNWAEAATGDGLDDIVSIADDRLLDDATIGRKQRGWRGLQHHCLTRVTDGASPNRIRSQDGASD